MSCSSSTRGAEKFAVEVLTASVGSRSGFIISSLGRPSIHQFGLTIDQFGEGGVVECGVNVEAGVEKQEMLPVLNELKRYG